MANFQAGFACADVTPPLGIEISGYFVDRYATGILDALQARALAVRCGGSAILIALDNLMIDQDQMLAYRIQIAQKTGLTPADIFISCSHTHTGPLVGRSELDENKHGEKAYGDYLGRKLADCALLAMRDLKDAKLGYAVGCAPHIAFVRRFRMKDGSIRTNPGVDHPDIDAPIGEVDERVNVLRIVRAGAPEIVVANFGVHPDTIGGTEISADYPHFVRKTTEAALPNVRCLFFNGAEGDVNHVNVHPTGGDRNGLHPCFDDADRGYDHARHMGQVIAGAILQVYEKVAFTDVSCVRTLERLVDIPSNMPTAEEAARAEQIVTLHNANRDAELPFEGMELTTAVAEALRMKRLKNGPASFSLRLTGVRIGSVAFLGIPGEPFTGIGRGIKAGSPFAMTLPCSLTNGAEGYYPMKEAYDEGGYEARSSKFKAGVAELLIEESLALLDALSQ